MSHLDIHLTQAQKIINNQHASGPTTMAPNLASSKLQLIYNMISSNELSISQMAKAAGCSKRTIIRLSSNVRLFGSIKAPPNNGGQPRSITPIMLEGLYDHLLKKPDLYLNKMALFL
jgi:hypothetical protein